MVSLDLTLSLESLKPILQICQKLDLTQPEKAWEILEGRYPFKSEFIQDIGRDFQKKWGEGAVCQKGDEKLGFSRLTKPIPESFHFSVDLVTMTIPGPTHKHPQGEINLCFAVEGHPLFDQHSEGWVIFPPGSQHTPTVTGGRMNIIYILPAGSIEMVSH